MSSGQTVVSEDFANQTAVVTAQPDGSEVNGDINAGTPRRSAWNRPSNGVLEPGSVMGGTNWPALSESTRSGMRSSSVDTSKPIADVSVSSSQAHVTPQSSPRQANANSNINSSHNNPRSRNRGLGSSSGSGNSHNNAPSQFATFGAPYHVGTSVLDNSKTGPRPILGVGASSQPHVGNDHSSNRNHSRRGNHYGPWAPRGEEQYHNNHGGGRRDHDHRRDVHAIPQYMTPHIGYMISPRPHTGPAFIPPVFSGAMGYDMAPIMYSATLPLESYRTMPPAVQAPPPPPPPYYFTPSNENHLANSILKQIDYYFSDENLVKDAFLRERMDENGWVPISLIASFRRVQNLTQDIPLILDSLRQSTIVEVQGDRIRRRNDWNRWLLSSGHPNNNNSASSSSSSIAASLQGVSLNDSTNADRDAETKKQEVSNGSHSSK